jgi:hypothetical protein
MANFLILLPDIECEGGDWFEHPTSSARHQASTKKLMRTIFRN